MRPGEYLGLLAVGLENTAYNAGLALREAAALGRFPWWWRLRAALARHWAGLSPFAVVRREGPASGLPEEDLIYGETPPLTAYRLLEALQVGPRDRVVDLGCGRGTVVLVAALAFGAAGLGCEALPTFVERGRRVACSLGLSRVEFRLGDVRGGPLPQGTVYFVAGTTLRPESWRRVCARLKDTAPGTRAASLSAPLPASRWELLQRNKMPFSWGPATVYLQRRRDDADMPVLPPQS